MDGFSGKRVDFPPYDNLLAKWDVKQGILGLKLNCCALWYVGVKLDHYHTLPK